MAHGHGRSLVNPLIAEVIKEGLQRWACGGFLSVWQRPGSPVLTVRGFPAVRGLPVPLGPVRLPTPCAILDHSRCRAGLYSRRQD